MIQPPEGAGQPVVAVARDLLDLEQSCPGEGVAPAGDCPATILVFLFAAGNVSVVLFSCALTRTGLFSCALTRVGLAAAVQNLVELLLRRDHVGTRSQRLPQHALGRLGPIECVQRRAELKVGLGEIGIWLDGMDDTVMGSTT